MPLDIALPSADTNVSEDKEGSIDGIPVDEFHRRLLAVVQQVDDFVDVTYYSTGAASEDETKRLLEGLKYIKDKKDLEGWESYANGRMQMQRDSAIQLYSKMMNALLKLENKAISRRTIDEVRANFMDRSVAYKAKEKYIDEVLPERLREWEKVAAEAETLRKNPRVQRISKEQMDDIDVFLDKESFLELKYPRRRNLVDSIKAMLLSKDKGLEELHASVKEELKKYVANGSLHREKVGVWMRRVFENNTTPDEVKAFMKDIVSVYAGRWKKARETFNEYNKEMNADGIPHGLDKWSLDRFLLADYDQRVAYLDEVKSRMNDDVNESGNLPKLRLDIRHAMDTNDWDYAEELLNKAKAINPADPSLKSIERYLRLHQTKETGGDIEAEGMKAMLQLQAIMEQLPSNMRWMTEEALGHSNPNVLKRLWQIYYNRHWVIIHGYSDPHMDNEHSYNEEHQEATEDRIANGHTSKLERNIMKGKTATTAAMQGDCVSAQVVYTNKSGMHEVMRGVAQYADDPKFGYWTSVVDDDVTYGELREAVLNHMYLIKKNASIMRKAGLMYTSHGVPFSAN